MKKFLIAFLGITIALMTAGCQKDNSSKIIGYWMNKSGETISFSDSENCSINDVGYTYKIYDKNHLQIIPPLGKIEECVFEFNGDYLYIKSSEDNQYEKFTKNDKEQQSIKNTILENEQKQNELKEKQDKLEDIQETINAYKSSIDEDNTRIEDEKSNIEQCKENTQDAMDNYKEQIEDNVNLTGDDVKQMKSDLNAEIKENNKEIKESKNNIAKLETEIKEYQQGINNLESEKNAYE